MIYYDLEVEWMDGRKETFHVGGRFPAECEKANEGVLYLFYQSGPGTTIDRVASIPLNNVRKWGEVKK